jgi:hypothetical protein
MTPLVYPARASGKPSNFLQLAELDAEARWDGIYYVRKDHSAKNVCLEEFSDVFTFARPASAAFFVFVNCWM